MAAEPTYDGPEGGAARLLTGWGRTAPTLATVRSPRSAAEVEGELALATSRGAIARGLGRSYGDAAQNAGGTVLDMTELSNIRSLDLERDTVTVGGGVSLGTLIRRLLPFGRLLPVTPGTSHVTVGGAIACDIHGKGHHRDGSFGNQVLGLTLLTPAGERLEVSPGDDAFEATAGGMGLTGVVVEATLRTIRVETSRMRVDTERAADLDDVLTRMDATDDSYGYSVAWIDCLARGRALGRSVLMRGDHATLEELEADDRSEALALPRSSPLPAPPWVPSGLLRRATVGVFNELYFRRAPREERGRPQSLFSFFYPLDAVRGWNRLYGAHGLLQYQFVVPFGAEGALREALERLSGAGCPSFLAVLKRFGPQHGGLISFPMPGWTLALDVPAALPGLGSLLDGLDDLVAEAGGRVYLAKDSRLRPDLLEAMHPGLGRWREVRGGLDPEGTMRSDLGRRLGIAGPAPVSSRVDGRRAAAGVAA